VTLEGVVTTIAGLAGSSGSLDGTGSAARFNLPWALSVNQAGDLYVAEFGTHIIRKVTQAGGVTKLAGKAGLEGRAEGTGSRARFRRPAGVGIDNAGNVYVSDSGN